MVLTRLGRLWAAFWEAFGKLLEGLWQLFGSVQRFLGGLWRAVFGKYRFLGLGLVWIRQEAFGRVSGKLLGGARRAWEGRVYGCGASKLFLERMYARQR